MTRRLKRLALPLAVSLLLAACATPPGPSTTDPTSSPTVPATLPPPAVVVDPDAAPPQAASQPELPAAVEPARPVPAPIAIDPINPDRYVDLNDASAATDLWERVRRGFAIPDLDTSLVRQQEQWYATRPDYVARMTERSSRYLYHIVEEVEKRGLPTELALLPFIESAFNPEAMSRARASGMWQFMSATGRAFDLTQNVFRDDRRDVLASTRAALDYLEKLHAMFGDWHLALAAYNWGEGSVQRAIARNRKARKPTDYLSLRMPAETRHYVPKLQAVKNIVSRPQEFSLTLPHIENHPYFLTVPIERDIDLDLAARLAGMPVEEFKKLNPQMNRPLILAAGTPQVLLPYDNANRFVRGMLTHQGPFASWTAWVAPRTMHPGQAAQHVGMTESDLRTVNLIPPRMLVKQGSTLLVERASHIRADVPEETAENAVLLLTPEVSLRRIAFKAGKRGSTVAAVAKRYRVSATQVAEWNNVETTSKFSPGETIYVYKAVTPTKRATSRAAKVRSAKSPAAKVRSAKKAASSRVARRTPEKLASVPDTPKR